MVRSRFTAVLLICSFDSGIPQEFYSVKGSIGGTSNVFKYTFDINGTLLNQEKTEEVTIFRR